MVEAVFERSPSYVKQFQNQFKFLVTNEKINLSSVKNFAVCSHFDSTFCQLTTTTTKSTNHFYVLIDTSDQKQQQLTMTFSNETKLSHYLIFLQLFDTCFHQQWIWRQKTMSFLN